MTKYNRPNGKLFGSSASNIGVFGSGQTGETPTTSTDPNAINTLNTHWEDGWNGAVVSQAPYTAPFIEDMNAVNYVNSYNSAYLLQRGIPEYDSNEEYQTDSVCTYNGEIWICLQDSTTNVTPTEGAYWHLQGEVPVMQDNEVLVGDTGNGATVTDTLNQGDILATTSGLDIKAGVVTNTHISSQAGDKIAESKVNLTYSTSTLNTNIGNVSNALTTHTSDTANPHQTTVSNLDDTNISGSLAGDDTLVYDGINSKWVNIPNTVSNLKDATVTTPTNNDVLWYYNGVWVNTPNVNNHMTSKVNPHETEFSNLHDATISTPSDQDTVVYDNNSSKWINQPNTVENLKNATVTTPSNDDVLVYNNGNWENSDSLANHLSDKNNPHDTEISNLHDVTISTLQDGDVISYDLLNDTWKNGQPAGGALSTLSDATITSPTDKQLVQYDYANSKWVNSSDVWDTLTANDVAYVGATPQGHTIDGSNNVTMLATDNRHQVLTATDGYNIILPSTGIKAGEKFVFEFTQVGAFPTTSMQFFAGASAMEYAHIGNFAYMYTALVDNPSDNTGWGFKYLLRKHKYFNGYRNASITATQNIRVYDTSPAHFTIYAGYWHATLRVNYQNLGSINGSEPWVTFVLDGTNGNAPIPDVSGLFILGVSSVAGIPRNVWTSYSVSATETFNYSGTAPVNSSMDISVKKRTMDIKTKISIYNSASSTSVYTMRAVYAELYAPVTAALS